MFDVGKPLRTSYRLSQICPNCGSSDYKTVKPAAMVAFSWDRVCRACSTRYTPPTPVWARMVFGVIGLGALALAAWFFWMSCAALVQGKPKPIQGFILSIVIILVGVGCLYKAATK